ncbi:MAG TPA: hypothetical protein DCR69_04215 [Clostridium sp.]|nr:hypothetical protein [Clostridium sp.]
MPNVLKQRISSKQAMYDKLIEALNKDIATAKKDYSTMCNDYGKGVGHIRHNSNLSKEGKKVEAKKHQELFIGRVQSYGEKHLNSLLVTVNAWEQLCKESNATNDKYLIGKKLPQLMYVTTMLNLIDSPELLNEMFEYVCDDENFSNELVNLVQAKANSMMKAYDKPRNETVDNRWESKDESTNEHTANAQMNVIDRMKYKKIIQGILDEINQYKTDYSKDAAEMKQRFEGWIESKKYPTNIFVSTNDEKRDFGIPEDLADKWGAETKTNDPWNK